MEQELTLRDGRKVTVRDMRADDDPKQALDYLNALVDEKAYIQINKKSDDIDGERKWFQGQVAAAEAGEAITWVAVFEGKIAGIVEARRGKFKTRGNISLAVGFSKPVRGQGLGKQVLLLMLAEIKTKMNPKNIYLHAFAVNEPAIRLYKSVGFREVGRLKDWNDHFGEYRDQVTMVYEG